MRASVKPQDKTVHVRHSSACQQRKHTVGVVTTAVVSGTRLADDATAVGRYGARILRTLLTRRCWRRHQSHGFHFHCDTIYIPFRIGFQAHRLLQAGTYLIMILLPAEWNRDGRVLLPPQRSCRLQQENRNIRTHKKNTIHTSYPFPQQCTPRTCPSRKSSCPNSVFKACLASSTPSPGDPAAAAAPLPSVENERTVVADLLLPPSAATTG